MKSITIHNMETDLSKKIETLAKEQGVSLNKLIKRLLRKSLALPTESSNRTDLSLIRGTLSKEDQTDLTNAIDEFSTIAPEEWQ